MVETGEKGQQGRGWQRAAATGSQVGPTENEVRTTCAVLSEK